MSLEANDLKIGEMYAINGRRARLESFQFVTGDQGDSYQRPYDASAPYLEATFSVGRKFERQVTVSGNRWYPARLRQVEGTWEEMKARKASEKAQRQEAEEITKELRGALEKMGLRGGFVNARGEVTIYGDLPNVRTLTAIIAAHVEETGSSPEALSSILD